MHDYYSIITVYITMSHVCMYDFTTKICKMQFYNENDCKIESNLYLVIKLLYLISNNVYWCLR